MKKTKYIIQLLESLTKKELKEIINTGPQNYILFEISIHSLDTVSRINIQKEIYSIPKFPSFILEANEIQEIINSTCLDSL